MEEAVIVGGARTPIGTYGKALKDVPASQLGATAIKAALERSQVAPDQVQQVFFGCVGQVAEDSYISRTASVGGGVPHDAPAVTVNRLCGSGLEAINQAARAVQAGDVDVVIAGGVESMSNSPFLVRKARFGYRLGHGSLEDNIVHNLTDPFHRAHMGALAERLVTRYEISRAEQDDFAFLSNQRAVAAQQAGRFTDEIVPVPIPQRRGDPLLVDQDEDPDPGMTRARLDTARPAFLPDGTITAGNSCGINDGSAAVVIMSRRKADELGVKPLLRIVSSALAGVDPAYFGIGPVSAIQRALAKAGLALSDMGLVELNEAFAVVPLACGRELHFDMETMNVNGGAVAMGHPIGATGAILTVKLLYEMRRRGTEFGLVSLCIGGGQGIATVFQQA